MLPVLIDKPLMLIQFPEVLDVSSQDFRPLSVVAGVAGVAGVAVVAVGYVVGRGSVIETNVTCWSKNSQEWTKTLSRCHLVFPVARNWSMAHPNTVPRIYSG